MERRKFLIGTGTTTIALLAGCSSTEENASPGDQGDSDNSNGNNPVTVADHELFNEGKTDTGVRGTLKNTAGEVIDYVGLYVYFLDDEGNKLGEGLDNTSNLAAGNEWEFKARYFGEKADQIDSYEIETDVNHS